MTREQLREVLDKMGAFVMVLDKNRRVRLTNFYALTGLTPFKGEPPLGKLLRCSRYEDPSQVDTGVYPNCPDCPDCKLRKSIKDSLENHDHANNTDANLDVITSQGVQRYEAYVSTRHIDLDGEDFCVLTLMDITTLKHFADELNKARRQVLSAHHH